MGAGIEPGGAAAEDLDLELAGFEVEAIQVGDLKLAAFGRLEGFGEWNNFLVVEIETGNGVVGLWLRRFFLKGKNAPVLGKLDDAICRGVGDVIAENRGALRACGGVFERGA